MDRSVVLLAVCLLMVARLSAEPLPQFDRNAVWNENISNALLHPDSAGMIATLDGLGGFGVGRMQIDFSLHVVQADNTAPTRLIEPHSTFTNYYLPDCEPIGTAMPVPANATIEGLSGLGNLDCDNTSSDCHLLVVQERTLYEVYSARESGSGEIEALCLAVWYLDAEYPPEGRGEHCTSADAAGFPIAPLLFNADEVAASLSADPSGNGDLGHAVRFILPNDRMASDPALGGVNGRLYVRPASHAGGPSGPADSVPYGARLRLRDDFPLEGYNPAARVILNTFKRYGIVLADGGNIALTAESDLYTTAKWSDPEIDIDSRVFDTTPGATDVQVSDFEVIDTGPRIGETYNCVPSNIIEPGVIFRDRFLL